MSCVNFRTLDLFLSNKIETLNQFTIELQKLDSNEQIKQVISFQKENKSLFEKTNEKVSYFIKHLQESHTEKGLKELSSILTKTNDLFFNNQVFFFQQKEKLIKSFSYSDKKFKFFLFDLFNQEGFFNSSSLTDEEKTSLFCDFLSKGLNIHIQLLKEEYEYSEEKLDTHKVVCLFKGALASLYSSTFAIEQAQKGKADNISKAHQVISSFFEAIFNKELHSFDCNFYKMLSKKTQDLKEIKVEIAKVLEVLYPSLFNFMIHENCLILNKASGFPNISLNMFILSSLERSISKKTGFEYILTELAKNSHSNSFDDFILSISGFDKKSLLNVLCSIKKVNVKKTSDVAKTFEEFNQPKNKHDFDVYGCFLMDIFNSSAYLTILAQSYKENSQKGFLKENLEIILENLKEEHVLKQPSAFLSFLEKASVRITKNEVTRVSYADVLLDTLTKKSSETILNEKANKLKKIKHHATSNLKDTYNYLKSAIHSFMHVVLAKAYSNHDYAIESGLQEEFMELTSLLENKEIFSRIEHFLAFIGELKKVQNDFEGDFYHSDSKPVKRLFDELISITLKNVSFLISQEDKENIVEGFKLIKENESYLPYLLFFEKFGFSDSLTEEQLQNLLVYKTLKTCQKTTSDKVFEELFNQKAIVLNLILNLFSLNFFPIIGMNSDLITLIKEDEKMLEKREWSFFDFLHNKEQLSEERFFNKLIDFLYDDHFFDPHYGTIYTKQSKEKYKKVADLFFNHNPHRSPSKWNWH